MKTDARARDFIASIEQGATPPIEAFVDALGKVILALYELEGTPQDPGWHAEGNVLIHTGMVLDELYELLETRPEAAGIEGRRRTALILGAALHDIAKPGTTREMEIQGVTRIAAPRHELRGRSELIPQLMELGLDWPTLELADMLGRRCEDRAKQVEHIELFGMFAREYGAWRRFGDEAPRWRAMFADALASFSPATADLSHGSFVADMCAGTITMPEEGLARSYRHREGFPELVVVVGPSGAGKSTWIEGQLGDHQLVSLDEIRAELGDRSDQSQNAKVRQIARDRLRAGLRSKAKIVWDATSLRRDYRDAVTNMARDYGALVTMVCFPRATRDYYRRNRERTAMVPVKVLERQLAGMQWPEAVESHRRLVIGLEGEVLAYYGGLHAQLPYGLEANEATQREPGA